MKSYVDRGVTQFFLSKMAANKVLVLLGPRRVGKTVFLKRIMQKHLKESFLLLNGDDMNTLAELEKRTVENYKRLIGSNKILIIDEAQKIPDIGNILKLIVDNLEGIKIIATGSSVFDLTNKFGEPLTGRKSTLYMFPFTQRELSENEDYLTTKSKLEERLLFGTYPELTFISGNHAKADYLKEIVSSYLLKDILEFDGIRNSSKILNLLRLIAFQTGKEVSLEELGKQLMMSRNTVERYLDLLSKVFVVYRLPGFSKNLRSEITKTSRWYFFDNGIRNTIISNFNPLNMRNDVGGLWENYVLAERIKHQHQLGMHVNNFFWRTYQQQEIDWIEEREGKLFAYEVKWNMRKKVKTPPTWAKTYPESSFEVINPDNYLDWIM